MKFPKCLELGAEIEEFFNLHTEKPYWSAYFWNAEVIEQTLTQAENKGKYEERDRNIKWLWNQDNALCDEFKKEFPRKEKEEMGMNLLVKAEQSVLDKVEIRKQKEHIAKLEHKVKYSHQMEDLLRDDYKKCELELKTAKQDGAKAERERILKRLDDADCQCCGDTERIKVELMK